MDPAKKKLQIRERAMGDDENIELQYREGAKGGMMQISYCKVGREPRRETMQM